MKNTDEKTTDEMSFYEFMDYFSSDFEDLPLEEFISACEDGVRLWNKRNKINPILGVQKWMKRKHG